jgi:CelD/BcsL family acetyltransferase involved in cellulose biosynthesis
MEVRRVKDFSGIGSEQWNALCLKGPTNTIFQTYEWHTAWWQAYGGSSELYLLRVDHGPELVGIAPMMVYRANDGARVLAFIGVYRSDYLDFVYDGAKPGTVQAIVSYLGSRRGDWDRIDLSEIPERSTTHSELERAALDLGLCSVLLRTRPCPTLVIKGNETQVRKIINKKKLRYFKRHFEERPGYRVRHLAAYDEISPHLPGFFEQHIARWAGTPTPSIFLDEKSRAFYGNLIASMCDKRWITFTVLESEGAPIAYHFGFTYNKAFVVYKPTYNPLMARRSPGLVLLKELLGFALAAGYDEFDFTVGDEPYKRRFASEIRHNRSYSILKSKRDVMKLRLRMGLKRRLEADPLGRRAIAFRKSVASRTLPRLKETVTRYGFLGWIRRAAVMAFHRFIFRYSPILFFEMPEGIGPAHPVEARLENVTIREANISDLARFAYPESSVLKPEFLAAWRKSLEEGDKCFIAEVGGEVAAMIWVRTRDHIYISETETYVPLEDSPACFCNVLTLPKFRGKNLLTVLYARGLEEFKAKRKVVYLYENNIGSMRAVLKLGNFRAVRTYHLLKILGIRWRWSRPYTGPQPKA